jgi:glutamate synthase domain-containing protein 2
MRTFFIISSILLIALTDWLGQQHWGWYLLGILVIPYVATGVYDCMQGGNNVTRNYPVVGHIKQIFIANRELIQDWILENEREVRPFDWIVRDMVYARSKNEQQTVPFGTKYDYYKPGYEWLLHSNSPSKKPEGELRVMVGGPDCKQAYSCSILNVSAMSFGSISDNATLALNGGARLGNFATNTGEGGLTEHHLKYGGDVIFQFGTAYFGCRDEDGNFNDAKFAEKALNPNVKMIEIKISQGAKPGFGAILPGEKVNAEVARIRGIKAGLTIISPAGHSAFTTPIELMQFVKKLRDLSGGKPIGYKFCLGKPHEMVAMCKAMIETGIKPDFITIDGGEGGTGAAHYDSANWVGMPLEDALPLVYDILSGFGLKKHIRLFVAGKITAAFHIAKYLALGADACYSARGMMFALGCVQALQCDKGSCPTGVTTTSPALTKGLVPEDKKVKVYNYHRFTLDAVKDLVVAAGLNSQEEFRRADIARRTGMNEVKTLDEIYPYIPEGSLLNAEIPAAFQKYMHASRAESFERVRA